MTEISDNTEHTISDKHDKKTLSNFSCVWMTRSKESCACGTYLVVGCVHASAFLFEKYGVSVQFVI